MSKRLDLDRVEKYLNARLLPWVGRASLLVKERVHDARAHGEKALTETLRQTPDGRPTARKFQQSRSYLAALSRLNELQVALIGWGEYSLDGLIRDAREEFYTSSFGFWLPYIPEEFRKVPDPKPSQAGVNLARGAIIHGYDLTREIGPGLKQAKDRLYVALNAAARRGLRPGAGKEFLSVWQSDAISGITARVTSALSDSDKALHEAAGQAIIHPEYLHV